jgi:large subunit ribosomal protein L44e
MKIKKLQKRYCEKCLSHTVNKIEKVSKNAPSSLSWIARQKKRRGKKGNLGKFKKKVIKSKKVGKRPFITSSCTICLRKKCIPTKRSRKWTIE